MTRVRQMSGIFMDEDDVERGGDDSAVCLVCFELVMLLVVYYMMFLV